MTFYVAWAVSFNEPERGAELADRAIGLNPNYPFWSARLFAYAYYMVGRNQDALTMLDRLGWENYGRWQWMLRPSILAMLGRKQDAKSAVQQALQKFPELSLEWIANDPGTSDLERKRLLEGMRSAGFPACARPEDLAKTDKPVRPPECGVSKDLLVRSRARMLALAQGRRMPHRARKCPSA